MGWGGIRGGSLLLGTLLELAIPRLVLSHDAQVQVLLSHQIHDLRGEIGLGLVGGWHFEALDVD